MDKTVKVKIGSKNKNYYMGVLGKLPYHLDDRGRKTYLREEIQVGLRQIPPASKVLVRCKCSECGSINNVPYDTIFYRKNSWYNTNRPYLCARCSATRVGRASRIHTDRRYPEYKANARKRGIDFKISSDFFAELVSKPCHYCGGFSKDRNKKSRGNGVDRIDSKLGYYDSNCVPCCATCNFVKNSMPYKDFILYIRKLYERTKNYEV